MLKLSYRFKTLYDFIYSQVQRRKYINSIIFIKKSLRCIDFFGYSYIHTYMCRYIHTYFPILFYKSEYSKIRELNIPLKYTADAIKQWRITLIASYHPFLPQHFIFLVNQILSTAGLPFLPNLTLRYLKKYNHGILRNIF